MNRRQRRRLERAGKLMPNETLSDFIRHPDRLVKRHELLGIVDKLIRLHELRKKRNRWYQRFWRWMDDKPGDDDIYFLAARDRDGDGLVHGEDAGPDRSNP